MHTMLLKCLFVVGIFVIGARAECDASADPLVIADCLNHITSAAYGAARQNLRIVCEAADHVARCISLRIRDCIADQVGRATLDLVSTLAVDCCPERNANRCPIRDDVVQKQRCFAADSLVNLADGTQKTIAQLQSGDNVLAFNHQTKQVVATPFLTMLDFQPHHFVLFKQITTITGRQLSLSSSHLLLVDHQSSQDYVMAKTIQSGMNIFVMNEEGEQLISEQVANVSDVMKQGYMAPLTNEGTLIVNNIAASCYATINSHDVAHAVLSPMRWWYNLFGTMNETNDKVGVHWFASMLYEMTTFIMPSIIHY